MNDLLKKLNTLVKAGINELLGDDLTTSGRRKPLEPGKLGKNIDQEISALRQRINEAIEYEDTLKSRVQTLEGEVAQWDKQAGEAVTQGSDDRARYAIEQMQRVQQRLKMAEADLREHQLVTQELIQRVNTLEAAVADARRAREERESTAPESTPQAVGRALSDVLRDAREKITSMGELVSARSQPEPADQTVDDQVVEDDLSRRRERLSKPK